MTKEQTVSPNFKKLAWIKEQKRNFEAGLNQSGSITRTVDRLLSDDSPETQKVIKILSDLWPASLHSGIQIQDRDTTELLSKLGLVNISDGPNVKPYLSLENNFTVSVVEELHARQISMKRRC
jgi:hypothetical protein